MAMKQKIAAAILGCALCMGPGHSAFAETLRVVDSGISETLNIPMNRAVVLESDISFAELSIANPNIADISTLSDRTVYVLGKSPGLTTLTLLDEAGHLITNVDVRVSADVSEFKERLRQILPNEQIEVRTANDGIVLSGTVSSAARLDKALELAERYAPEKVSNLMSVGGIQQVMLKVRFAEMQRTVSKSLSGSLAVAGSGGVLNTYGGTGTYANANAIANAFTNGTTPATNENRGAALFNLDLGSVEVGVLLEALEAKGAVRTLAEPNLTALSGQEATFLAGGEYPVPTSQDNGQVAVEFKPFGVELRFVPRVVDGDLINLELKAEVSAIDPTNGYSNAGFQIDAFRRRETSTTVEMRDGESFAVAGLLQDDFRDLNGQVPWLGDVPVLGALFRSAEYARQQSELVIIVTPHLVSPTRGEALALPITRVTPPSEKDLFLFGRIANRGRGSGGNSAVDEVARQDFNGPYGYILD